MKSVKLHLLQTLNELFCGELGIIQIIHETNSENGFPRSMNDIEPETGGYTTVSYEQSKQLGATMAQVREFMKMFSKFVKTNEYF